MQADILVRKQMGDCLGREVRGRQKITEGTRRLLG